MFRGGLKASPLDRTLATGLALAVHASAFGVAALLLDPTPRQELVRVPEPQIPVVLREPIHSDPPQASASSTATPHPRSRLRRTSHPTTGGAPLIATVTLPRGRTPENPRPALVPSRLAGFDPAPSQDGEPPRHDEVLGDSVGRRGGHGKKENWYSFEIAGPSVITPPSPGPFCVPRAPRMPDVARAMGIGGTVEVVYEVDPDGVVSNTSLTGDKILCDAVRAWLRGCLFEPARQDGVPVHGRVRQRFDFEVR